ncbi:MAG: hypothetical protein KGL39_10600 [Patescibacteria group bacterium]|nr:hypothetical protein [Patescibacteria group bacterium]
MQLIDFKCLAALKKIGFDKGAIALAKTAEDFGAASASNTLIFLGEGEEADADYIAKLTLTVEKVT